MGSTIITGKQVIAVILIIIALANMVLFALGKVHPLWFWGVIAVCAAITFWVFPRKE